MIEIQRLEEERKSLKAERERLGETFETKLRRAQSLYETELTAAKMLYSKELEALRDHEEALKEELLARFTYELIRRSIFTFYQKRRKLFETFEEYFGKKNLKNAGLFLNCLVK